MKTAMAWRGLGMMLFIQLLILCYFRASAVQLQESGVGLTATIKGTNVNVRESPSVSAKVITKLQDGELVTILEMQEASVTIGGKTDNWYFVSGNFGKGWVFGAFLVLRLATNPVVAENIQLDARVLCADISNLNECHDVLEREWIRHYPEHVKRGDGKLLLKMDDGKWSSYADNADTESDGFVGYALVSVYESPRIYFLGEQHYEGGGWIIISRKDGAEYEVMGNPIFSPSMARFACYSIDLQAGYDPTGFEIWSWSNGNCIREYEVKDGTDGEDQRWGPTGIAWVSENTIRVTRVAVNDESGELFEIAPIYYEFAKGKWQAVRR